MTVCGEAMKLGRVLGQKPGFSAAQRAASPKALKYELATAQQGQGRDLKSARS
jgi:hypothetical protein